MSRNHLGKAVIATKKANKNPPGEIKRRGDFLKWFGAVAPYCRRRLFNIFYRAKTRM